MSAVAPASAAVLVLALTGCDRGDAAAPRGPGIERLLDSGTWRIAGRPVSASDVVAIDVCGDVRPGWIADAGAPFECETTLPRVASWLDVDAALLPIEGELVAPPARLTVELRVGERTVTIYDAIPSAGTPPTAFGFGRARIELGNPRGERATFLFRVTGREPTGGRKAALGNPRIAPRVTAAALTRVRTKIDFLCRGPGPDELASSAGAQRWPAFRRLQEAGAIWKAGTSIAPSPPRPDAAQETACFGPLHALRSGVDAGRDPPRGGRPPAWDLLARCDPYGFRAEDPFVTSRRASGTWDEALLRDRVRALGERALLRMVAQPRPADAEVVVATQVDGSELDAALARLLDHLRANELWDRTDLVVRVVRASRDPEPAAGEELGAWVKPMRPRP